jgi:pseudouridylate synthase
VEHLIRVADEVRAALSAERPIVALETTLVAHGFPAPAGIEVGLASEVAVRAAGATPATIGVLDGLVVVGLTADELERFTPDARKLGPRDLAACAVQRVVGATTVGGTLAAASVSSARRPSAARWRPPRRSVSGSWGRAASAVSTGAFRRRPTSPPTSACARACPP